MKKLAKVLGAVYESLFTILYYVATVSLFYDGYVIAGVVLLGLALLYNIGANLGGQAKAAQLKAREERIKELKDDLFFAHCEIADLREKYEGEVTR